MVVNIIKDADAFKTAISSTTTTSTDSKSLIVIDCFAEWCGPCHAIAPKIEEFSNSPDNANVGFYKVDVDNVPSVAQELGVRAMPTFVFFKGGEKVDEVVGAVPPAIQAAINRHKA